MTKGKAGTHVLNFLEDHWLDGCMWNMNEGRGKKCMMYADASYGTSECQHEAKGLFGMLGPRSNTLPAGETWENGTGIFSRIYRLSWYLIYCWTWADPTSDVARRSTLLDQAREFNCSQFGIKNIQENPSPEGGGNPCQVTCGLRHEK